MLFNSFCWRNQGSGMAYTQVPFANKAITGNFAFEQFPVLPAHKRMTDSLSGQLAKGGFLTPFQRDRCRGANWIVRIDNKSKQRELFSIDWPC